MKTANLCGIGEVLFDCFGERQVLGGAPLNAIAVASQLGRVWNAKCTMVSRVGDDSLGKQIRQSFRDRDLSDQFVQIDPMHATGKVFVGMKSGEPNYTILAPAAWDFIEWSTELGSLAAECDGLIFGTLAQRSDVSRSTIQRFVAEAKSSVRLLDVNLRQHFFTADLLDTSLKLATAVKLNQEELHVLQRLLEIQPNSHDSLETELARRYELDVVILTQGKDGTMLIETSGERHEAEVPAFAPADNADPVGAGDACAAACLLGLVHGWQPQKIAVVANKMGAFVASQAGATPQIPASELL